MLILLICSLGARAEETDHADHEELRALLKGVVAAMNSQKYEDLMPYFHEHLRVTTINQDVITRPEGLEPYFRDWIGPGKYVRDLKMQMEADDRTEFYGEGESRFGVVRGSGVEDYNLTDGRRLDMRTRWTATVMKDKGRWRILALHIGANFYRNPIVEEIQNKVKSYSVAAGLGGLLAGLVLGLLLGRASKK